MTYLEEEQIQSLDEIKKKTGIPKAVLIRKAISDWLELYEKEQKQGITI